MWRGGTLELNPHRAIPEHEEVATEAAQQSLDGDSGRLTISSTISETKRDSGGAEFVSYKISCVLSGRESLNWVTRRRFSEFYDLHTRLNRMGDVRASLPTRNPFAKMSPSVVHAREQGLLRYLNTVLEYCSDTQCVLLAKFLQVAPPTLALGSPLSGLPLRLLPARPAPQAFHVVFEPARRYPPSTTIPEE